MNRILALTLCLTSFLFASEHTLDSRDIELCEERQIQDTLRDMESGKRTYVRSDSIKERNETECHIKTMQKRRDFTHK